MSATRGLTEKNMAACVSANVSRFRAEVSGDPRTVCVQARPELQVFLLDEWRGIRRNNVENHWNAFVFGTRNLERKNEYPLLVQAIVGGCQQKTNSPSYATVGI